MQRIRYGILVFFLPLDIVPELQNIIGGTGFPVSEHMWVAEDQFPAHAVRHVIQAELPLLSLDIRMENDLGQYIAQFLLQMIGIPFVDGLRSLVRFFEHVAPKALVSLFRIPRATARCTQKCDQPFQIVDIIAGFALKIYHIFTVSASKKSSKTQ